MPCRDVRAARSRTAGGGGRGVVPAVAPRVLQHLVPRGSAAVRRRTRDRLHTYISSKHQTCRRRSGHYYSTVARLAYQHADQCGLTTLLMPCKFKQLGPWCHMTELQVVSIRLQCSRGGLWEAHWGCGRRAGAQGWGRRRPTTPVPRTTCGSPRSRQPAHEHGLIRFTGKLDSHDATNCCWHACPGAITHVRAHCKSTAFGRACDWPGARTCMASRAALLRTTSVNLYGRGPLPGSTCWPAGAGCCGSRAGGMMSTAGCAAPCCTCGCKTGDSCC